MTIMMVADLSVVFDSSGEICPHQFIDVTAASADNLYPLCFKDIPGPLSHIAGKHHGNSHLLQDRSYTALAPASLRRGHLADTDHFTINNFKY